jgi:hypothetical protein
MATVRGVFLVLSSGPYADPASTSITSVASQTKLGRSMIPKNSASRRACPSRAASHDP